MAADPNALNRWESAQRAPRHARDPELEAALRTLNDHLDRSRHLLPRPLLPSKPVVFVVGCARGGSTLLMQWLASTGLVAYPTNLLSRFYKDPYVGALIHRILYDLDHKGEVFPTKPDRSDFRSELGRTLGANAPHDFGYLWRNYFTFGALQSDLVTVPDADRLTGLQSDVASMELVFQRPVMLKAMEMNWHIPLLRKLFPDSVFLFVQRELNAHAASILKARVDYFGDEAAWYSYKPAEYESIRAAAPWEQVVSQVWYTNRAVQRGLTGLPDKDVIKVPYDHFCAAPSELHQKLASRLGSSSTYEGPMSFKISDRPVDARRAEESRQLIERLSAA